MKLSILLVLLLSGFVSAAEPLIYGDDSYFPVMYKDKNGQSAGVLYKLLQHHSKLTGSKLALEHTSWRRAYEFALQGHGGVIGLSKTSARLSQFDYSDAIFDDNINIVVKKGKEFPYARIEDLKGKSVGVHLGASYGEVFDKAVAAKLFSIDTSSIPAVRFKKLLYGRVDCVLVGSGKIGFDSIVDADPGLKSNKAQFVILKQPVVRDTMYLGFAKSMSMGKYLQSFNQSIADAKLKKVIPETNN
ncbi:substrate-binding periplasmic protein [Iodobacter ciconiae]|uniref:Transporter substrate-binding domain-containing protein n=1 Tax=Iodobacter ciconiae TaxID=2496266 RepID=A0A3S8ZQ80_9NEIS|nr:transporter substrate-binding domain-containing protein [Iodobacter ciconiae]AZN35641.1 transporter substrate-binding domain-containing protein [Iodobacter ciconiae]